MSSKKRLSKWSRRGFRITWPKTWIHPYGGVGVKTAFGITGDFEITTAYEILQAEKPPSGFGVGAGLRVFKAEPSGELANVAHVVRAAGQPVLLWNRSIEVPGQNTKYPEGTMPWPDKIGRLRFKRTGASLSFLAAPGLVGGEYFEIRTADFGGDDIRSIALIGFNGRQPVAVDVRFLDLSIKSGGPAAAPVVAHHANLPPNPRSSGWLAVLLVLGLGSTMVLALALGAWAYLRPTPRGEHAEACNDANQGSQEMIDRKRKLRCQSRAIVVLLLIALSPVAHAQEPTKEYAQEFTESFKSLPAKNPRWGWIWPDVAGFVKYDADGVRFDLPPAPAKGRNPVGLGAKLTIKGDFEITLSYEILGETQGTADDDGSYFGLAIGLSEPPGKKAGARLHRMMSASEGGFLAAMVESFDAAGKRALKVQPHPTKAKAGRLRMVRGGGELSLFASEGDDVEFALILKAPFGAEDVSSIEMSGGTQGTKSTLNVRLSDLRIRADAIPLKPVAMTDINKPAPKKKTTGPAVDIAGLSAPKLKVKFQQDFRGGDPKNPNLRFVRDQNIKWENEGARITMPAGRGRSRPRASRPTSRSKAISRSPRHSRSSRPSSRSKATASASVSGWRSIPRPAMPFPSPAASASKAA